MTIPQPAFPVITELKVGGKLGHYTNGATYQFPGMTLRDYFAAKAMHAITSAKGWSNTDDLEVAESAYALADQMLRARQS